MLSLYIDFGIDSSTRCSTRHFNRLAIQLDTCHGLRRRYLNCFPACGVIFSSSIRIDPLVNAPLLDSSTLLMLSALSIDPSLDMATRSSASSSSSMMRLLSFCFFCRLMCYYLLLLPPTQLLLATTRVVLPLCFDQCDSWCFYSRRCWHSCLLVSLWLDDMQEGFSIHVACGTKRTQHLFRDHFFLTNPLLDATSNVAPRLSTSLLLSMLLYNRSDSVLLLLVVL